MKDSKDRELIRHKGIPGYFVPRGLYELMEFGIKAALEDIASKDSIIKDNDATILELRKTLEERNATIYGLERLVSMWQRESEED